MKMGFLSNFERDERQGGEDDADDPEAHDDLGFVDFGAGALDDGVDGAVAGFLEVVVEGRHLEHAPCDSRAPPGDLASEHLDNHREVFDV